MAYQVLARKYRPLRFSDVVGQDHVTRTLLNALAQNRIAHGYIFSGHRGIGKTTIARILASALNCQNTIGSEIRPTPEPCNACDSCREIREGNAVDVIEIDAATNRGIDEIRELRDAARYRPARDKYKIYILDEAHQITDAAFNALLKTLEEPPDHIIFMMATTQPEDIPQTIRSRCQHYSFHAVKFDDILAQLRDIAAKESVRADEASLALLAEAGDGSMRDALSIMDQAIASAPCEGQASGPDAVPVLKADQIRDLMGTVPNAVFEELLEAVAANSSATVITLANRLLDSGNSPAQLARQLVRYLRNCVVAKIAGLNAEGEAPAGTAAAELLQTSSDERRRAARTAMLFSEEDLTRFLQVMLRTFDDLGFRQEQRFHFELGLLKLVHLQRLLPVEELLSQIPVPPTGGGSTPRPTPPSTPRSTSAPASTAASVPPPRTASPFESDRNRKLPTEHSRTTPEITSGALSRGSLAIDSIPSPEPISIADGPRLVKPAPAAAAPPALAAVAAPPSVTAPASFAPPAAAPTNAPINAPIVAPIAAPTDALTDAPTVQASAPATAPPATGNQQPTTDLETLQQLASDALANAKGHQSAADALADAAWSLEPNAIRVQLAVSKTMLPVLINAEAEKIIRETLRAHGAGHLKPIFEPGAAPAAAAAKKPKKASAGSAYSRASEHPLVQQAQKLFNAEIRNVLDLRDKD